MRIFPAIDLLDGRVVRLTKGDYGQSKAYDSDPAAVARRFLEAGAENLHVVDLNGARDGTQANLPALSAILAIGGLFVEIGGGGRNEESVRRYLDMGANRVILGTAAVEQPALLERLAARYPGAIAAGVDAKDGYIATHGWKVKTDIAALEFLKGLPERGVGTAVYTDISRDGLLAGTNLEAYRETRRIEGLAIVASGGISFPGEIAALRDMGIYGAILGKALYEGKLNLKDALHEAEGGERA